MTFEEWYADYRETQGYDSRTQYSASVVWKAAWDAATYAMNQEQGIAANEAAKHERMIKAAAAISILYPDRTADWEKLRTIIEEAQG